MFRQGSRPLLTILLSACAVPPVASAEPIILRVDLPPEPLAVALDNLASDQANIWLAAQTKLSEQDAAEPYLRHLAATGKPKVAERANEVLQKLHTTISKRNIKRAKMWIKDGRVDLVTDAGVLPRELLQGDAFGELLVPFGHKIIGESDQIVGMKSKGTRVFYESLDLFSKQKDARWMHGTDETTGLAVYKNVFVRAQSCTAQTPERHNWLSLTRESLTGAHPTSNQWSHSIIFHNNRITLDSCHNSLVICDGDATIENNAEFSMTTLIARGSIRAAVPVTLRGQCVLYASDEMAFAKPGRMNATLMAGRKVVVKKTENSPDPVIKQNVKENPFGVRFFETTDVGVETAMKGDALTITKLTPGSPLTKYGVKEGDVVTQLNDKAIKT
ncbi:MAG: hypothetical protein L0241_15720, partial [Planctomycetia bacterium]|nr:hypothetical protein [Planctomycetia bacterium]